MEIAVLLPHYTLVRAIESSLIVGMNLPVEPIAGDQAGLEVRLDVSFHGQVINPKNVPIDLIASMLPCLDKLHSQWGERSKEFPKSIQIEDGSLKFHQAVPLIVIEVFKLLAEGSLEEAWNRNHDILKVMVEFQEISKRTGTEIHIGAKNDLFLTLSPSTNFRIPSESDWVKVSKIIRGRIDEMGGKGSVNIHLTPATPGVRNPKQIKIETTPEQIEGNP